MIEGLVAATIAKAMEADPDYQRATLMMPRQSYELLEWELRRTCPASQVGLRLRSLATTRHPTRASNRATLNLSKQVNQR